MLIAFRGKCKNCGAQMEILFDTNGNGCTGTFESPLKCVHCQTKVPPQSIERFYLLADAISASSQLTEPLTLEEITWECHSTDSERQRVQQTERQFLQKRLKVTETEAEDH